MDQIPQLVGAVLILTAFVANQRQRMPPHSRSYLTLNLVGAGLLTAVALESRDWGFFLLEVVWTAVSAWGLVQVFRGAASTEPT